jgi:hypothetical protein
VPVRACSRAQLLVDVTGLWFVGMGAGWGRQASCSCACAVRSTACSEAPAGLGGSFLWWLLLLCVCVFQVWDVEKGEAVVTLEGFGGLVQDFDWNHDGSLLATSSKVRACSLLWGLWTGPAVVTVCWFAMVVPAPRWCFHAVRLLSIRPAGQDVANMGPADPAQQLRDSVRTVLRRWGEGAWKDYGGSRGYGC